MSYSLFKPSGRRKWTIKLKLASGEWVKRAGYSDKAATDALARKLEKIEERKAAGLPTDDLDRPRTPWEGVLAMYLSELRRRGSSPSGAYYRETVRMLNRIFEECTWNTLNEVNRHTFSLWLAGLEGCGAQTQNDYAAKLSQLCNGPSK